MRSHVLSNILHKVSSVVSPVIIWEPLKLFFRDLFSNAIKEERRKRKKNFESTWNRRNRGKESECFSGHNSFMVHRNRVESRVPSKMSERRRAKGKREQFESKNFDGPEQWRLSCSVSSGIKKLRNYSRLGRFKTRGLFPVSSGSGLKTSKRDEGKSSGRGVFVVVSSRQREESSNGLLSVYPQLAGLGASLDPPTIRFPRSWKRKIFDGGLFFHRALLSFSTAM